MIETIIHVLVIAGLIVSAILVFLFKDLLAAALGVVRSRPLQVTYTEELLKLTLFVPLNHREALLETLLPFSRKSARADSFRRTSRIISAEKTRGAFFNRARSKVGVRQSVLEFGLLLSRSRTSAREA